MMDSRPRAIEIAEITKPVIQIQKKTASLENPNSFYGMELKQGDLEISRSSPSIDAERAAPEAETKREAGAESEEPSRLAVYEANIPAWRLFVIIGG